ncbi:unnamed protein product [Pseudo-nitzschia multistriata]|uniref:Uncharacterized protein n=1 Tax=Pseudo-nitzschia multistriata TaxID=183589 RepID=A0A448Z1A5_9STRA|nr:unnamed protein product [Pseudo-nitzschia multistriata]
MQRKTPFRRVAKSNSNSNSNANATTARCLLAAAVLAVPALLGGVAATAAAGVGAGLPGSLSEPGHRSLLRPLSDPFEAGAGRWLSEGSRVVGAEASTAADHPPSSDEEEHEHEEGETPRDSDGGSGSGEGVTVAVPLPHAFEPTGEGAAAPASPSGGGRRWVLALAGAAVVACGAVLLHRALEQSKWNRRRTHQLLRDTDEAFDLTFREDDELEDDLELSSFE